MMSVAVSDPSHVVNDVDALVQDLLLRWADASAETIVADLLTELMPGGRSALVSSFGTEAAVLLHMVAQVDPSTPVLFIDTGKLFGETLRYRDALIKRLGLTGVQILKPAPLIEQEDQDGMLFNRDMDRCCFLRKVVPLNRALTGFDAWINGRKGHHGGARAALPVVETDGQRLKVTPLARWRSEDVASYFAAHDLPPHPLEEDGFLSVGCYTCTQRASGGDARSGRWAGSGKTECGIHTMAMAPDDAEMFADAWEPLPSAVPKAD
jgi:phosphoadenosine phosphosulfate reductase